MSTNAIVVKSSDVARHKRWDAAFYLALRKVKPRFEQLRRTMSVERVQLLLDHFDLEDLAPCLVLARGQLGPASLRAVLREYPHLCLALMEKELPSIIARVQREVVERDVYLKGLRRLLPTKGGSK